ncbi:MAG: hypothetical protein GTN70_05520 [Deltaproteobacteria bacterium]|nr:hypothetical protein [Deltaproteobacteria bacterium]NIS77138.1 hypothetical protein [Deltaproteobacteria bacterium]
MENILFTSQIGVSLIGGLLLFLAAFCIVLLGYVSDEEVERKRVFWAEWPLTQAPEAKAAGGREPRKAA